jgi:hypothetical protein
VSEIGRVVMTQAEKISEQLGYHRD